MAERLCSMNPDSVPEAGKFYYYITDKDNAPLYQPKSIIDDALTDISTLKTDVNGQATLIGTIATDLSETQGHVTDLQTDNETIQIAVGTHETEITALQTDNTTNKTDISDLKTTTSGHTSSITTLNGSVSALQTTVGQHTTSISELETDVTANTSDITELNTPIGQCFVSPIGNDTNTGSISSPFKTIQKALNELFGVINVLPGTFTENITIPVGYGQYAPIIQGYGTIEAPKSEIRGTLTIPAGISRLRIKNLQLDGKGEGSAIIDNGSDGRHILENVTLANAGVGSAVISVINGKNWWNISGSAIEGAPHLTGTPEAGTTFNIMYSPNSFLCTPIVESGYTFTAYCVRKMGYITHTGGNVYCSNVAAWYPFNGKIINSTSTSPTDVINVTYSGFTGDGINYGVISSTGATVSTNNNIESPYGDVCLSAVSTVASTLITTTPSTLIAPTKTFERNISYNTTNGELTLLKTGVYNIALSIRVDCTEWNKYADCWIERWNGTTWIAVDNSGKRQNFQTDQEGGFDYNIVGYYTAGDKYRLRAQSDSDTTVSVKTITLANGIKQPAIRISIS